MKVITVYGKTVEDAVRSGLDELGVSEDRVKVNVIEHPVKGLFGLIGTKEAKVELTLIPDPVEEATRLLEAVTEAMDLQAEITRSDEEDHVLLSLQGSDMGMVIGRRGQTLDALQYLLNVAANRHSRKHVRIVVDAEQFRARRKQTLEDLANRLASRVSRGQKEIVLEPMTPQERKIIHSYLQDHPKVKTYSKGEEPNRRVVIALK
jgi:spoIIIJ-associated protein